MSNIEQGLTKAPTRSCSLHSQKLPNYILCRKDFRMGNIEQGLNEAFVSRHKVTAYTAKNLPIYI